MPITWEIDDIFLLLLALMASSLLLALVLVALFVWRLRKIKLPANADLFMALQATPFVVVLVLDLLDFSLDFLSAPLAWTLLTRLGLKPLRGVTIIESLIPGTQFLPTMTTAWVLARLFGRQKWMDRVG